MLILGTGQLGPESLPCSFLIFHLAEAVGFRVGGGELTLDSPRVTTPCVRLGSD